MFQGANYKSHYTTKDIAKMLKAYLKVTYPEARWSVRTDYNKIDVALMGYPERVALKDNMQINGTIELNKNLTPLGKQMFLNVAAFLNSYNRDDSDVQRDYFDRAFYVDLEIGRYEKPFKVR